MPDSRVELRLCGQNGVKEEIAVNGPVMNRVVCRVKDMTGTLVTQTNVVPLRVADLRGGQVCVARWICPQAIDFCSGL